MHRRFLVAACAWLLVACSGDDEALFSKAPDARESSGGASASGGTQSVAGASDSGGSNGVSASSGAGGADGTAAGKDGSAGKGNVGGASGGANAGGAPASGGSGGESPSCVVTNQGREGCDGLDNDCDGQVDENNACQADCIGVSRGSHGYMLCDGTRRRDFEAAEDECADQGMQLVALESKEEEDFIRARAAEFGVEDPFWIGGDDREEEGVWRWPNERQFWQGTASGMAVGGLYVNWQSGKPNNAGSDGDEEDCALFVFESGWNDLECDDNDNAFSFVCERE